MSDKKNDDFSALENGRRTPGGEKDPFIPSPPSRTPSQYSVNNTGTMASLNKVENSPPLSILAYCLSSISMTVVNKYVVSGSSWNLNLFYLAVQVRTNYYTPASSRRRALTFSARLSSPSFVLPPSRVASSLA
jgi:GDP-mannose transporter